MCIVKLKQELKFALSLICFAYFAVVLTQVYLNDSE